jgi:excisionase family DNA binding protein
MKTGSVNKKYLDAKTAGKLVGYSADYVTRLARESKIDAVKTGRQWLIDPESLKLFTLEVQAEKRERAIKIREERKRELALPSVGIASEEDQMFFVDKHVKSILPIAFAQTFVLATCFMLLVSLFWVSIEGSLNHKNFAFALGDISEQLSVKLVEPIPNFVSQVASFAFVQNQDVSASDNKIDKKTNNISDSTSSNYEGIVVFDKDLISETDLKKVKESFSDEVEVEFIGDDSGLITPVFQNRSGDSYQFLLVPVNPSGR